MRITPAIFKDCGKQKISNFTLFTIYETAHYGYYGMIGKGSFPIPGKASGSIVLTDDLKAYANGMMIRGIRTLLGTDLVKIIPINKTEEFFKGGTLKITFRYE